MKNTRTIVVLLSLTIAMQVTILYKQYAGTGGREVPPAVSDAEAGLTMNLAGLPTRGSETAKVVLLEFSDYECPFCERHAMGVGKKLNESFMAVGKVRHVFINNPLAIHQNATLLATAAICAGEQQHYWEMHENLFERKPRTKAEVLSLAKEGNLDVPSFETCLDADSPTERIDADRETAARMHRGGTPSFAIGIVDETGMVSIKKFINGAQSFEVFRSVLTEMLDTSSGV